MNYYNRIIARHNQEVDRIAADHQKQVNQIIDEAFDNLGKQTIRKARIYAFSIFILSYILGAVTLYLSLHYQGLCK